tara:strand:- start:1946 stop:2329 length:384 start_codon:yes stop_codon:yes gene_type:complete
MAVSVIGTGSGTYSYGIETAETSVNVASFSVRYFPEFDDKLANKDGQTVVRARPAKFSREISVSGEVTGSSGLMAFTLTAACTIANDDDTFGDGSGSVILDEATESQERNGFRSVDITLSSDPEATI